MGIECLDFLSSEITIYFFGKKKHSSIAGGIFTIFMFLFCFIYISYIISELFIHKSPDCQFYRKYISYSVFYPLDNKNGIFHYFQMYNTENVNKIGNFDKRYIRIIMLNTFQITNITPELLTKIDHWVYDLCQTNDFPKNFHDSINDSICLRYYYNSNLQKYFPINDSLNFKFPNLIHGDANTKSSAVSTIIEKCQNNSITTKIQGTCANEDEINDYLKNNYAINILLLNQEVDSHNYKNPINFYVSKILSEFNEYNTPTTSINMAPLQIKTSDGLFLESYKIKETYIYEDNRKSTTINSGNILSIFSFWLLNNAQVHERKYKNLINDIFPSIGGIIQIIYYIFFGINKFFNKYIVLKDFRNLIFEWNNSLKKTHNDFYHISKKVKLLGIEDGIKKYRSITQINKNSVNLNKLYSQYFKNFSKEELDNKSFLNNTSIYKKNEINDISKENNKNIQSHFQNKEVEDGTYSRLFINNQCSKQSLNYFNTSLKKNYGLFSKGIMKGTMGSNNKKGKKLGLFSKKTYNFSNIDYLNSCNKLKNNKIKTDDNNNNNSKDNDKVNIDIISCIDGNFNKNDFINLEDIFHYESINHKNLTIKKLFKSLNKRLIKIPTSINYLKFTDYLFSLICCLREKKNGIYILEKFRKKLLSEEHLFRTNILLSLSEKSPTLKSLDYFNLIQLYEKL